jgi:O-antigen/teichoic acid export membrane protein
MGLARSILTNTFWMVLGRTMVAILGVLSIKIVTNYLPTDVYGQYTTVYEFMAFFAIAADFGLYTIGVREMAKKKNPSQKF